MKSAKQGCAPRGAHECLPQVSGSTAVPNEPQSSRCSRDGQVGARALGWGRVHLIRDWLPERRGQSLGLIALHYLPKCKRSSSVLMEDLKMDETSLPKLVVAAPSVGDITETTAQILTSKIHCGQTLPENSTGCSGTCAQCSKTAGPTQDRRGSGQ